MKGFGRLGGVLGGSWSVLGLLGVSWGRLRGVLARKRWPTWLQLGSENGAKIDKKSVRKTMQF